MEHSADLVPTPELPIADTDAETLLHFVQDLGVDFRFERSFKISRQSLLVNRYLLSIAKPAHWVSTHKELLDIHKILNIPERYVSEIRRLWLKANIIHFGHERNISGSTYKMYFGFEEQYRHQNEEHDKSSDGFLLHRVLSGIPETKDVLSLLTIEHTHQ